MHDRNFLIVESSEVSSNIAKKILKENIEHIFTMKNDVVYYTTGKKYIEESIEKGEKDFWAVSDLHVTNFRGEIVGCKTGIPMKIDYEAILRSLFDIIHITDREGRTVYCSSNYESFFGISPHEMLGKNIEEFFKKGYFNPSITGKVIKEQKKTHTLQTTFKNRKLFVVGTPVFDKDGNFQGVVNTSTDITHKEKLLTELEEVKNLGTIYFEEIAKYTQNSEDKVSLVYRSVVMNQIMEMIERLAHVDSNMILLGESGVGKGVLAKLTHQHSPRENKPFVHINCGAIPENLLESELFGYEKGAFTGASKDGKIGLIEQADGGTLFLDEIGELPLSLQVKLLTTLQEKTVTRIGGSQPKKVDIKLITATNRNLKDMVSQGKFREDLYYRIYVIPIEIPPLRERKEDIPVLIHYFFDYFSKKYIIHKQLTDDCYSILEQYDWPGNVRELENMIERLIVTTNGELITSEHIPKQIYESIVLGHSKLKVNEIIPISEAFEEAEKQLLQLTLKKYKTTTKIAEILGVSQPSVSRKLRKYNIHK